MTNNQPLSTDKTVALTQLAVDFINDHGVLTTLGIMLFIYALGVVTALIYQRFFVVKKEGGLKSKEVELIVAMLLQPSYEKLSLILENTRGYLKPDHLENILTVVEWLMVHEVVEVCRAIQGLGLPDSELSTMISTRCETIVHKIDNELYRLPNIKSALVSKEERIRSIVNRSGDFLSVVKNTKRYEDMRISIDFLVKNIIANSWKR